MILDFLANLDKTILLIVENYGNLIYPFLFLLIFIETGLVVIPFIPGDSLLFISGTLAAKGFVNVFLIFFLAATAAIIGDSLNYSIGKFIGKKICEKKMIKEEYLIRTQNFYEKYGGKTIIIARFIPIIRTFAPFIAGIGKMKYKKFLSFNIIGGILWTAAFIFGGFFFGNIPVVQNNLTIVILIIIVISFIPVIAEYFRHKKESHKQITCASV